MSIRRSRTIEVVAIEYKGRDRTLRPWFGFAEGWRPRKRILNPSLGPYCARAECQPADRTPVCAKCVATVQAQESCFLEYIVVTGKARSKVAIGKLNDGA